jgi:serine/threonine-protein kinase
MTIRDYIKQSGIKESPVKRGDPSAPVINLPIPEGWADAGKAAPPWAYGAIVFKSPANPADPPSVIAHRLQAGRQCRSGQGFGIRTRRA